MSLNQLALEMWERLGYREIDSSVLSRVLKGDRFFNQKQLSVFCSILQLSRKNESALGQALFTDLTERFGLDKRFFETSQKAFIEIVEECAQRILHLQEMDSPLLINDWVTNVLERIEKVLPFTIDSQKQKILLYSAAKLLTIQGNCILVVNPVKLGYSLVKNNIKMLRDIGSEVQDANFMGTANLLLGNSFYNTGNYKKALKFLKLSSEMMTLNFDNSTAGIPLRQAVLSWAYLKNDKEFEGTKRKLLKNLPSYSPDLQCEMLEGLSRAEAVIGQPSESKKALILAKKALKNNEKKAGRYIALRRIQLIRTEIESNYLLGLHDGQSQLEILGREGLKLSEKHGYKRHGEKIFSLLNKILN